MISLFLCIFILSSSNALCMERYHQEVDVAQLFEIKDDGLFTEFIDREFQQHAASGAQCATSLRLGTRYCIVDNVTGSYLAHFKNGQVEVVSQNGKIWSRLDGVEPFKVYKEEDAESGSLVQSALAALQPMQVEILNRFFLNWYERMQSPEVPNALKISASMDLFQADKKMDGSSSSLADIASRFRAWSQEKIGMSCGCDATTQVSINGVVDTIFGHIFLRDSVPLSTPVYEMQNGAPVNLGSIETLSGDKLGIFLDGLTNPQSDSDGFVFCRSLSSDQTALVIGTKDYRSCNALPLPLGYGNSEKLDEVKKGFVENPERGVWTSACISHDLILSGGMLEKLAYVLKRSGWQRNDNCPFNVIGHGDASSVLLENRDIHEDGLTWSNGATLQAEGSVSLGARSLAQLIRTAPHYKPGQHVHLFTCNGGAKPDGIAQQLATELGVEVSAFEGLAAFNDILPVFWSAKGYFWPLQGIKTFYPQGIAPSASRGGAHQQAGTAICPESSKMSMGEMQKAVDDTLRSVVHSMLGIEN